MNYADDDSGEPRSFDLGVEDDMVHYDNFGG